MDLVAPRRCEGTGDPEQFFGRTRSTARPVAKLPYRATGGCGGNRRAPKDFSGGARSTLVLSRSCLIARPGGAGGTGGPRKTFREGPVPPAPSRSEGKRPGRERPAERVREDAPVHRL